MPLPLVYEEEEEAAEDADAPHTAAWGVLAPPQQQPQLEQLQAIPALRIVRVVKRARPRGESPAHT